MPLRWHGALAYAITGRRWPELSEPGHPDCAVLLDELSRRAGGAEALDRHLADARRTSPWPRPVPADLLSGLGAAQFRAALADVRAALPDRRRTEVRTPAGGEVSRPVQRLLDEVPPHHHET